MSKILTTQLKMLMAANDDMTLSELAKATDVPKATLHHILSGKTKRPRREILEKIANYFSVSINTLLLSDDEKPKAPVEIPLYSLKSIIDSCGNITLLQPSDTLMIESIDDGRFLGLIIENNMYAPLFPKGAHLIISASMSISNTNTIVIYDKKNNTILLERAMIDNHDYIYFKDKNSSKENNVVLKKVSTENHIILGVVLEVRYKLS